MSRAIRRNEFPGEISGNARSRQDTRYYIYSQLQKAVWKETCAWKLEEEIYRRSTVRCLRLPVVVYKWELCFSIEKGVFGYPLGDACILQKQFSVPGNACSGNWMQMEMEKRCGGLEN